MDIAALDNMGKNFILAVMVAFVLVIVTLVVVIAMTGGLHLISEL